MWLRFCRLFYGSAVGACEACAQGAGQESRITLHHRLTLAAAAQKTVFGCVVWRFAGPADKTFGIDLAAGLRLVESVSTVHLVLGEIGSLIWLPDSKDFRRRKLVEKFELQFHRVYSASTTHLQARTPPSQRLSRIGAEKSTISNLFLDLFIA